MTLLKRQMLTSKSKTKRRIMAATLFAILSCGSSFAQMPSLVLYTEHFPPYSYLVENQVQGINAQFLREACLRANITCQFELYPWLRAYDLVLHNPNSGIFSIVKTQKREPKFQWLGPLASSQTFLYRLKSRPDIQIQQLSDAKNYSIGVAHGDIFEEFFLSQGFEHGKNLLKFSDKAKPIPLFLAGKIDLLIGSELVLPDWLLQYQQQPDSVEAIFNVSEIGQNYLALNPKVSSAIVIALELAMEQLRAEGQLQRIIDSHHRVSNDPSVISSVTNNRQSQ